MAGIAATRFAAEDARSERRSRTSRPALTPVPAAGAPPAEPRREEKTGRATRRRKPAAVRADDRRPGVAADACRPSNRVARRTARIAPAGALPPANIPPEVLVSPRHDKLMTYALVRFAAGARDRADHPFLAVRSDASWPTTARRSKLRWSTPRRRRSPPRPTSWRRPTWTAAATPMPTGARRRRCRCCR